VHAPYDVSVPLLLLFIIVPILELLIIGQVADVLGLPLTLLILFGDGVIGAWLVKREGRRAWDALRLALREGRWPGDEGALVVFGGALLLTPGFLTDVVGLLSMMPPSRALIARQLQSRVLPAGVGQHLGRRGSGRQGGRARPGEVLDVEVLSIEPDDDDSSDGVNPSKT